MANEQYTIPRLPYITSGYGLQTPFGILLPPGGQVAAFVRSTGPQDQDSPNIGQNLVATLASGLDRCRSGLGDTVVVLPGHTESGVGTTGMANLKAGTKIIGVGQGAAMPTFRWTATGDQWALNKADVTIAGLRLRLEGANGIVKGILVTGADVTIHGCDIEVASGATNKATIAIEVGAGANKFKFIRNNVRGTSTHNVTDGLKVVAAVEDLYVADNLMHFSATAANGNMHVTAAALRLAILGNVLTNDHTASVTCIGIDAVAMTGVVADNYMAVISAAGVPAVEGITTAGAVLSATALLRCFNNLCCTAPATSGIVSPALDA